MSGDPVVMNIGAPADEARIALFRRRARPAILTILALFTAAVLLQRTFWPADPASRYARIIGQPYTDIVLYFGVPQRESEDGRGGHVAHYDEFQVVGDHFEKKEFRIYVNADERVYKFERD